ncbi:MAG: aryl-sulfate sulfotransferase [Bacteroidetes bacterium]|nr:aryl-sulfate sulfotransferase [Bacteroidota bacterium]
MGFLRFIGIIVVAVFIIAGCKDDSMPEPFVIPDPTLPIEDVLDTSILTLNPSGYAPLSALMELTILDSTGVRIIGVNVRGKSSASGDLKHNFELESNTIEIPVLGLYPDHDNIIDVSFYTADMAFITDTILRLQTAELPLGMPLLTSADVINPSQDINSMIMVSYAGGDHINVADPDLPQKPFIMDKFADIRWYLDYSNHPELNFLRFGHGLERLMNGNLYFGDEVTTAIYEIDMLGFTINQWDLTGWGFHHEVWEKSNGNFLICANNLASPLTIEDYVIELDRSTGNLVNVWDLKQSLQANRFVMDDAIQPVFPSFYDWIHVNGLTWDDSDNTLIVSGREQGTIKLNQFNQVEWIISNHRAWGTNGIGQDLNQFLLTPLDANDIPITDTSVLNGWTNHPDFEWNWYQHSPLLTPEGTLMLFDNGGLRNWVDNLLYSRAVEYEIDEVNMTIKQHFQYGKERGQELFAAIVSDVDYDVELNSVIFGGGTMLNDPDINLATRFWGKHVEVDRISGNVIAEYTVEPYKPLFFITFNRTEKMDMYVQE